MRAYNEAQLAKLEQEALSIARRMQELHGVDVDFGLRTTGAVAKSAIRLPDALLSRAMEMDDFSAGITVLTRWLLAGHD
jgi:hypothetical protein